MKKYLCLLFCFLVFFLFSGCQKVVANTADELTLSEWTCKLENGNTVSLSFDESIATLQISLADGGSTSISGLCELSDSAFVIHDSSTKKPYAFSYIVYFNRVEIVYNENTVSLYKS